jgi:hypothetical protein
MMGLGESLTLIRHPLASVKRHAVFEELVSLRDTQAFN